MGARLVNSVERDPFFPVPDACRNCAARGSESVDPSSGGPQSPAHAGYHAQLLGSSMGGRLGREEDLGGWGVNVMLVIHWDNMTELDRTDRTQNRSVCRFTETNFNVSDINPRGASRSTASTSTQILKERVITVVSERDGTHPKMGAQYKPLLGDCTIYS